MLKKLKMGNLGTRRYNTEFEKHGCLQIMEEFSVCLLRTEIDLIKYMKLYANNF